MKLVWFGLPILLALILLIFYLAHRNSSKTKKTLEKTEKDIKRVLFPSLSKGKKDNIKKIVEEHQKKRKDKEREELFHLFGVGELKSKSHVDLLDKIVNVHKLKKRFKEKEMEVHHDSFKAIKKLFKGLENKQKSIKDMTEKEAEDVFKKLKKIVKKR